MSEERGVHIFVMHSWTKIWSCTGVRLGSVVAPTPTHMVELKKRQVCVRERACESGFWARGFRVYGLRHLA